jgi:hypothetical protein
VGCVIEFAAGETDFDPVAIGHRCTNLQIVSVGSWRAVGPFIIAVSEGCDEETLSHGSLGLCYTTTTGNRLSVSVASMTPIVRNAREIESSQQALMRVPAAEMRLAVQLGCFGGSLMASHMRPRSTSERSPSIRQEPPRNPPPWHVACTASRVRS